jgi:serine O-acetyltransferase
MRAVGADAVVPPRRGWATRVRTWRAARRPRVRLDAGVRVGRGVRLHAAPGRAIVVGEGAALGDGAVVEALRGDVRVGPVVGDRASLRGDGGVTIGAECVIGAWARVEGPARVGDRARLAAHAAVLGGADVGAGAVIGSYAVVHDRVAPRAVVERGTGA